jgi:hypothetical protein
MVTVALCPPLPVSLPDRSGKLPSDREYGCTGRVQVSIFAINFHCWEDAGWSGLGVSSLAGCQSRSVSSPHPTQCLCSCSSCSLVRRTTSDVWSERVYLCFMHSLAHPVFVLYAGTQNALLRPSGLGCLQDESCPHDNATTHARRQAGQQRIVSRAAGRGESSRGLGAAHSDR